MSLKSKVLLTILAIAIFCYPTPIRAGESINFSEKEIKLNLVFKKYNSPLQGHEKEFLAYAQKYNLDWSLLAAIAGTESAFAKKMPYQCLNPFGWGIYGRHRLCFPSFKTAIETVSLKLGTKYDTSSLESIAKTYNPSHTQHWLKLTRYFIFQIKNQPIPASKLPFTL